MSANNAVELLRDLADGLERERQVVADLLTICREVDIALVGVCIPADATARLKALRSLLKRIDEGDEP